MIPPKPTGNSNEARWHQWVHESLVNLLTFASRSPNALVSRTTRGIFIKPNAVGVSGPGFKFPPGIGLRELSVCVRNEDGSTEEKFIKVYGTVLYSKNSQGQMVDDDGNLLDEYANPTT